MISTTQTLDAAELWARIVEQDTLRVRLAADCLPRNKAAIFDALASVGIASVIVLFDGYGDSGQIDSVDARTGDTTVVLPMTEIDFEDIGDGSTTTDIRRVKLPDAVEALAYRLLYDTYPGCENNDGAFGELNFDVVARSITLDHNVRFTDATTYSHVW